MLIELGRGPRDAARPSEKELRALARELRGEVRGEVRFDEGSRALYATDASNYRQVPLGLVLPRDAEDVRKVLAACRARGAAVLPRGGGTSLAGQTCNAAVVLDFSKYMRKFRIDPERGLARAEPGVVLDDLRRAAARHGLTFGPDPATHRWCTLGGMIGNNSCGVHSVMAGPERARTADQVEFLDVLTYRGVEMRVGATGDAELARILEAGGERAAIYARLRNLRERYADRIRTGFPALPRRVSGYNLDELLEARGFHVARALAGTEGTCAVVLEAEVRLLPEPPARALLVLGYPDVFSAGDHVKDVLESGPTGLEGIDEQLVRFMLRKGLHPNKVELLPEGRGWLLAEFGGESRAEASDKARALMARLEGRPGLSMKLLEAPEEQTKLWEVRESGLAGTAHVPGMKEAWPGWEDAAVPPARLGEYLRAFRDLLERHDYHASLYGHFGQGCVHCRIDFDLKSAPGIEKYRGFVEEAADLVLSMGGSLSGEHGDGQARAALLEKMYGPEIVSAFREFKGIWDPDGKMNPGKVVDPYPITSNLRLGSSYNPPELATHFAFPEDGGSFTQATLRCVGVGKCRREDGGTMCPSYMVTREEKHATRGRARLLFEMVRGETRADPFRDPAVKDALDLCVMCKGCKGECPVHVDMATYKAEFLSHYYEKRRRPLAAYAMGLVHRWARLAALAPRLANLLGRTRLLRRLAGLTTKRPLPRFAERTFRSWFAARPARKEGRPVLLWPDTFHDHFRPEVGRAAVRVLEAAGFRVLVPRQDLCCGRPYYDYGMLDRAKASLREILDALGPFVDAGLPVVGLEPSCVSVFRDEMPNLFPRNPRAERLAKQTKLLSELLDEAGWEPPRLEGKAIVHDHCHQKSVLGVEAEHALLRRAGLEVEVLDSGCCGLAGSFGYEAEHHEIAQAMGERRLLPALRAAPEDAQVITNGFSCASQIAQNTERRALHLAEVLERGLDRSAEERRPAEGPRRRPALVPALVLPALALAALALRAARR